MKHDILKLTYVCSYNWWFHIFCLLNFSYGMFVSSSKYKEIRRNEITGTLGSKLLIDANASYIKCFKWKVLSNKDHYICTASAKLYFDHNFAIFSVAGSRFFELQYDAWNLRKGLLVYLQYIPWVFRWTETWSWMKGERKRFETWKYEEFRHY